MSIAQSLNVLTEPDAKAGLVKCCASRGWVAGMLARRPFASDGDLAIAAMDVWWSLSPEAWLEAFAAHPMIGDLDSLRAKFAETKKWASSEQAGVQEASDETLRRLAEANLEYRDKFGYIFIVCATGKTADEMLAILEERLVNNPAIELPLAAAEQLKITQLRLQKLVP
jgi:OHCU decarboxylase